MNMFKNNGGFTLVELIVVIAILAILAGVAVPAYSGYISKANEASDMSLLDSVKTAVIFDVTEKNPSVTLDQIVVTLTRGTDGKVTATKIEAKDFGADAADTDDVTYATDATDITKKIDISDYVDSIDFKSGKNIATWTLESSKWVLS